MRLKTQRDGEYQKKGDYHKELDINWHYLPIYVAKLEHIEKFIQKISKDSTILDAGCGEGVLVEKYKNTGYNITGLDLCYSSDHVIKGSILDTPFNEKEFDVIMCLDVIEHLNFEEQKLALKEFYRILKDDGILLIAIPNLAHFASRVSFLLTGKLIRTSTIERHKGDRPIKEYLELINSAGFKLTTRKGIFPTYPISSILTFIMPSKVIWLHKILNKLLAYPNWCFLNIIVCKKK